jgi:hypothetical protein
MKAILLTAVTFTFCLPAANATTVKFAVQGTNVKKDNSMVMLKNRSGKGFVANFGAKGVTLPRISYNNAVVGNEDLANRYAATTDATSGVVGGERNSGSGTTLTGSSRCEDAGLSVPWVTLDGTPNITSTLTAQTFTHYYNTLGGCPLPGDYYDSAPVFDENESAIGEAPSLISYSCTRAGFPGGASTPADLDLYIDFTDISCI